MAGTEVWPPKSPLKTLLSSPSGRKKYREYQDSGLTATSPNKLLGSPSLLDKLRAARADRDHEILLQEDEEPEEDEETLQLKLQAIEAKLKLKKLQQQRAKDAGTTGSHSSINAAGQSTATSSSCRLEVALSPAKQSSTSIIPKSPSRILLGIDKGLHGEDVSLRRARTINGSPTKPRESVVDKRIPRQIHAQTQSNSRSSAPTSLAPAKTFSERMADMRHQEKDREQKQSARQTARSSHFKFDRAEMQSYKNGDDQNPEQPHASQVQHGRDVANPSQENKGFSTARVLKHSRSMPAISTTSSQTPKETSNDAPARTSGSDTSKGDPSLFEGFSNTHLSTRILPHSFLKRTLPQDQFSVFTIQKLLKHVTSPSYEMPEDITDFVVFGIVASKTAPRNHKPRTAENNSVSSAEWEKKWNDGSANRQKFIVLQLTDLKWSIDLFLFDNAVPRYHRLAPGTVIAILNPGIMPPKKGSEDTGAFSLALHDGEDQVLEIGTAQHLAWCNARKKDGSRCTAWVDGSKTEVCEYHLSAQINRTRGGRGGINSMTDVGKEHNKEKTQRRRGFDYESQSFYYAVGGVAPKKTKEESWTFAPTYDKNLSTARLLDLNPNDDPFIAEGQLMERDKQDRLRKRMAAMQKEHEIAKKLGNLSSGAGGEYMRQRTVDPNAPKSSLSARSGGPANCTIDDIMTDRPGENKKRAADSVRLGPVKKKTRFLTDKGIKEAGRESLGPGNALPPALSQKRSNDLDDDDDDDDLDIV